MSPSFSIMHLRICSTVSWFSSSSSKTQQSNTQISFGNGLNPADVCENNVQRLLSDNVHKVKHCCFAVTFWKKQMLSYTVLCWASRPVVNKYSNIQSYLDRLLIMPIILSFSVRLFLVA